MGKDQVKLEKGTWNSMFLDFLKDIAILGFQAIAFWVVQNLGHCSEFMSWRFGAKSLEVMEPVRPCQAPVAESQDL